MKIGKYDNSHQHGIYLHTLTAFVSEILLVRTISASSTKG